MTAQPHDPFPEGGFPAWELAQQAKHELVDGVVYAFAGGTIRHTEIAALLIETFGPIVRPCRTLGSDALIETATSFRYADVVVTCDKRDAGDAVAVRYPKLIVEVVSQSTVHIDNFVKPAEYQTLATLEQYVLVDSRKRWAQVITRRENAWITEQPRVSGPLELRSIGVTVDLDWLYDIIGVETLEHRTANR